MQNLDDHHPPAARVYRLIQRVVGAAPNRADQHIIADLAVGQPLNAPVTASVVSFVNALHHARFIGSLPKFMQSKKFSPESLARKV